MKRSLFLTVLTVILTFSGQQVWGQIISDTQPLVFKTNDVEAMRIDVAGNVGIGLPNPGQKLHIFNGHILLEGGEFGEFGAIMETTLQIKRDTIFTGGPSGDSINPIFLFGSIGQAGDGDPEIKLQYTDDGGTTIGPVLKIDRKGIVASVGRGRDSHFEAFLMDGDTEPVFRLVSEPEMRLEMGEGGTTPVDVAIQREAANTLTFRTGGSEQLRIDSSGNVGIGTASPDNILTIQPSSATDPIADAWTTYSSRRWKTNVETLDDALGLVSRLRGVRYQWKADGRPDIGLIAEEVGDVIPEIVAYEENGRDAKSVDYARLVAVLIEGIKEQQTQIERQQATIDALVARVSVIEQKYQAPAAVQRTSTTITKEQ